MLVDYGVEEEILGLGKQGFHFLFTHPDKEETIEQVEQLYDEMEKTAAMTPASVKRQGINPEVVSEDLLRENIFIAILMPALTKVNQIAWRNRAESESMLAILGVLQCEKEHGELPQSLDVLVEKGLLNEVPIDPFSDKPLVYRKTDDGFTLYSVGLNFIDDGGMPDDYKGKNKSPQAKKWTEKGDTVFWPVNPVNSQQ